METLEQQTTVERREKLYVRIASLLVAYQNCIKSTNHGAKSAAEWKVNHGMSLRTLAKELPHGSGFDNGTKIDLDKSTGERLVFHTSFHHMDENGYYNGWTEHDVIVTASLWCGLNIRITGRNRNDIKDLIHEAFDYDLRREIVIK